MSDDVSAVRPDVGDYCRQVEDHLTRVNGGHLVRVVGPAFELVRRWAESGVPLSVVFRGIERKAERRALGRPGRPLRLEFCEGDVDAIFAAWRRAIGVASVAPGDPNGTEEPAGVGSGRKASLGKHLDRAIDRLSRAMGRMDWPDGLKDDADRVLAAVAGIREEARVARGGARDGLTDRLHALDADLSAAAAAAAPAALMAEVTADAERDLAPFRGRLAGDAWRRSLAATVDRQLRDRFGLPTLVP